MLIQISFTVVIFFVFEFFEISLRSLYDACSHHHCFTCFFNSINICSAKVNANSNKNSNMYFMHQVDTSHLSKRIFRDGPVFGKAHALLLKDFTAFYEKPKWGRQVLRKPNYCNKQHQDGYNDR